MEVEITWKRALRVWWSYFWRNLVGIVAAAIVGMLVGFVLTIVLRGVGLDSDTAQTITVTVNVLVGLAISVIPLKMILGKRFGEFRLVLVAVDRPQG